MNIAEQLGQGLTAMDLHVTDLMQRRLADYVALLKKWNQTYNLSAIRNESDMVTQHVLDSLSIIPALQSSDLPFWPRRWADIGSGAGLPGIPLAIVKPELEVTLVDAVEKKSAFQRQAKIELNLSNISVVTQRVETIAPGGFDALISRAFAELADFITVAGHLLAPSGTIYAMKGVLPANEMKLLPPHWKVRDCIKLTVPGLDAQRHLIVIEKV